ncbi:hypothetical protein GGH16_006309, partial [Coemansia sp. RSA 560]
QPVQPLAQQPLAQQPLAQQPLLQTPPVQPQPQLQLQQQADCAYISDLSQAQLRSTNEKKADVKDITVLEHTLSAGSCIKPNLKLFEEYLAAQAEVAADLTWHYNETMCNQQDGTTTPKVPLHCKLRLSAFINQQQANQLLINRLKKRFSQDDVFILGNWSASMTQFHEPIHGKGWRTLLKRGRFNVYLIDEYLTSKT